MLFFSVSSRCGRVVASRRIVNQISGGKFGRVGSAVRFDSLADIYRDRCRVFESLAKIFR